MTSHVSRHLHGPHRAVWNAIEAYIVTSRVIPYVSFCFRQGQPADRKICRFYRSVGNTGLYRNDSIFLLLPPGLSITPPVDFIGFPRWRPHTGSIFRNGFGCSGRVFLLDDDCLRVAHLNLALDPLLTGPEEHFRSAAATVENTCNRLAVRQTVGIHRKTASHTPGNRSEQAPPAMSYYVDKRSKMTGPTSPDLIM